MERKETERITVEQALEIALGLHKEMRLAEAEEAYRAVLEAVPEHPGALHFLGVAVHQLGRSDEAVDLIRKAVGLAPEYIDARINLGNVLKECGRLDEAEASYREALALDPDRPEVYNNLGTVEKERLEFAASEASYRKAIELNPEFGDAFHNLGNVLRHMGRQAEAAAAYTRAVELRPYDSDSYRKLGCALYSVGKVDEALAVFRQWAQNEPMNEVAKHMVAACSGEDVPDRASDEYVEQVFDSFSKSFDERLSGLGYRAPEIVARAVAEAARGEGLDILDAGCGTGLCGPLLRPLAGSLVGVDLSRGMLAKAEGRGVYDELAHAELTEYLGSLDGDFDAVVSADTFCYFGVLGPAFAAAAGALRPGGVFVFTVEDTGEEEPEGGFELLPHGRYAHSEGYVRRTLESAGFEVLSTGRETLRMESEEPVTGLVVTARRPG